MIPDRLKCSLRKECPECGKEFGRKIRHPNGRAPYLECKNRWLKRTKFCSVPCKDQFDAKKRRQRTEEKRLAEIRKEEAFIHFLYPGLA